MQTYLDKDGDKDSSNDKDKSVDFFALKAADSRILVKNNL